METQSQETQSQMFKKWLAEHQLTMSQAVSLSYVPYTTMQDVAFYGKNNFTAVRKRLHVLTGIESFRPSEQEELARMTLNSSILEKDAFDLAVCEFFVNRWKNDGVLPSDEDSLQVKTLKKSKPEHSEMLQKKYFKMEKGIWVLKESFGQSKVFVSGVDPYTQILDDLDRLKNASEKEQSEYMRVNGRNIKKMYGWLGVLMQNKKPADGFKELKNMPTTL